MTRKERSFRVEYAVLRTDHTWDSRHELVPEDLHPEVRGDNCRLTDFLEDRAARETLGEGVAAVLVLFVPPLEDPDDEEG